MTVSRSHWIDAAGVRLHVEERGCGSPVVLLHGFTGSTCAMAPIAEGLSGTYRILSVDLVGHGRSARPHDPAAYTMDACVGQLAALFEQLDLRDAHLIGYSMGGRVALAFCAAHPQWSASALLVGASAGIRDPQQRSARIREDEALAERIECDGVEAFVDFWISQPFLVHAARLGKRAVADARRQRLRNSAHALAECLRGMGSGAQRPIYGELAHISIPICLAVGADDSKFRAIAMEIAQSLANASVEIVPAAGHAAHTDHPEAFLDLARGFLAEVELRNAGKRSTADAVSPIHTRTT